MGTKRKIAAGVGIIIILLIGIWGIYPSDPITVVYASADGEEFSIESPLPPYAYLNGEGILVVDVSPDNPFYPGPGFGKGLSINSTYVFEGVFVIENNQNLTGEAEICVRISSEVSNIGFFTGTFNGSWSDVVEVTIPANESVEIGARIDTHGLTLGDYTEDFTIEAWGGNCG